MRRKAPPPGVRAVLAGQRQRIDRLAERGSVARLRALYTRAQAEAERNLRHAVRRVGRDTYTAHIHRQVVAQMRDGQAHIARRMAGELSDTTREAQVDSLNGLISDVDRLSQHFRGATLELPIAEASRFYGVIDRRRTSLLRMNQTSMARYGAHVVTRMQEELGVSLATGQTTNDAIDRLMQVADLEWWQAERIARTETAWAYNATHADGIAEVASEIPDMMQRWSEHVDDFTLEPLDDRVGTDSIAMHGQVAPAGGSFTMPDAPDVSEKMWGLSWSHPPNRPNDRAVIQPWMPDWGIPGWVLRGGRKVPVTSEGVPARPRRGLLGSLIFGTD